VDLVDDSIPNWSLGYCYSVRSISSQSCWQPSIDSILAHELDRVSLRAARSLGGVAISRYANHDVAGTRSCKPLELVTAIHDSLLLRKQNLVSLRLSRAKRRNSPFFGRCGNLRATFSRDVEPLKH
jgi:hypothetical protein